ncbi:MAG: 16S rRNA (guanine(527)-N(7))-methyltransferase RsmG [Chitinophagaceae bacterium]|nr:16S rRNA (guanine(527)-N(7))-methyltransferase RsmG [Chitinophagaceae bacterium]
MELITKYFTDFTPHQLQLFDSLFELYAEWNSRINVISRKDIDSLYEKHVLHSLSIAAVFEWQAGMEIIDIGTGGGFPGIPLAIFFPEVQFHLVDSVGKKIKVVNAVAAELGLQNVTTQHGRAEEIKNRRFDTAVSRAVAPLVQLLSWSKPLLRKRLPDQNTEPAYNKKTGAGQLQPVSGLICLKGGDLAMEIAESNSRPLSIEIFELFNEEYFKEKYILFVDKF